jgi:maleylacetoacetate isomerase
LAAPNLVSQALPMKLYGFSRSSAAFRVRIALNLKGLEYENASIHLRKREQEGPEYLAVNPQGLVPALEIDGHTLIQSPAIVEYLDECYPDPPLLPADPADRARVRALAAIVACDIHPVDNLRVLRYLVRPLGHDEAAVATWFNHWIEAGFRALEPLLAGDGRTGTFCHGDTPGLADITLVPQVFNSYRYSLDLTPFPTIQRICQSCMKLDAFAAADPRSQADFEA